MAKRGSQNLQRFTPSIAHASILESQGKQSIPFSFTCRTKGSRQTFFRHRGYGKGLVDRAKADGNHISVLAARFDYSIFAENINLRCSCRVSRATSYEFWVCVLIVPICARKKKSTTKTRLAWRRRSPFQRRPVLKREIGSLEGLRPNRHHPHSFVLNCPLFLKRKRLEGENYSFGTGG